MQQPLRRLVRPMNLDRRQILLLAATLAILVLVLAIYLFNLFQQQRQATQRNALRLAAWHEQLLTATPKAQERAQLLAQLASVQERYVSASGLLPGTDVEVALVERILEAAERSGVELATLRELDTTLQEGSLIGWQYEVAASGSLQRLTDFTTRLEQEAFPAAFFSDPHLSEQGNNQYLLGGTLTIYGSTLSSGTLAVEPTLSPDQLSGQLREEAEQARERGDFERALSLLLRLSALEPDAPDVDQLLYNTYVDYGNALLVQGRPLLAKGQFEAALVIDPGGSEAVAGLVSVAQLLTQTPPPVAEGPDGANTPAAATATSLPPSPVVPPTPEPSPTEEIVLPPTTAPPPTRTPRPIPTSTPEPEDSPTPADSPTPSATETPAVTPNPFPFGAMGTFYLPNCALTQVKGTIRDSQTNAPVNGVTVRVWFDGAAPRQFYSLPSGEDPTKGAGEWDVVLDNHPKEGQWYVAVVDRDTGAYLSEVRTVFTDAGPCRPGESGHQVVIQDFVKYGEGPGRVGPTSTATRVPSATTPPTRTPTPSVTPSITPSPTATPISHFKNEEPDKAIPDGPGGRIESPVDVPEDVKIRTARVLINIEHEDVADLEINMIHPDGTRIRLHSQGENAGKKAIRDWFTLSNELVKDKSSKGRWMLEVIDTIEGKEGTLLSWTLEIYP